MEEYCRTCAKKNFPVLSVFTYSEANVTFSSIIEKYLPLKLNDDKGLPSKLCTRCADTLSSFELFASAALQAEAVLREMVVSADFEDHQSELPDPPALESSDDDLPLSVQIKKKSRKKRNDKDDSDRAVDSNAEKTRYRKRRASNQNTARLETHRECVLCLKSVRKMDNHLRRHFHSQVKLEIFYCPICNEISESVETFCFHMCQHFGSENHLVLRELTSSSEAKKACVSCDESFIDDYQVLAHAARHLDIREKFSTIHCFICGKSIQKMSLRRHFVTHDTGKFICHTCGKQYANVSCLSRHYKKAHQGEPSYKCPVCHNLFTTHEQLREHQTSHEDARPYQCDACGQTFLAQKQLYHHRKYHHTETGLRVPCSQCQKIFCTSSALRRHMKTVHLRIKEFQCDVCSAQLSTKQYLKEHLRTHSEERTEMCTVCGKTFRMKGNLRQHMKTHTERGQVCEICSRRFARRSQLVIHMESHKGISPYMCQHCGKTFIFKKDLIKHLPIHDE